MHNLLKMNQKEKRGRVGLVSQVYMCVRMRVINLRNTRPTHPDPINIEPNSGFIPTP